ncbi:hypothetical protein [Coprobacter sp.]
MIDRIKFYIDDVDLDTVKERLELRCSSKVAYDESERFEAEYKNLKIKYVGKRLQIEGSLHKFVKGNNYSLFTYEEAKEALCVLSKYIGISLELFIVSSIELAINIQMEKEIEKYLVILHSYKTHPFIYMPPMKGTSKLKGRKCHLAEYTIKFYDKTFEAIKKSRLPKDRWGEVPKNLLRYEIQLSRKQLRNKGLMNVTGKNLLSPLHYTRFKRLMNSIFDEIIFDDITINYSGMLEDDVKRYIFAKSERYDSYLQYLKEEKGEKEYRKERRRTNELLKRIAPLSKGEFQSELESKLELAMSEI